MIRMLLVLPATLVLLGTVACQNGNGDAAKLDGGTTEAAVQNKPRAGADKSSPGKPSAPIDIAYEILGEPVVGIPLSINVRVSSQLNKPITMSYQIVDSTSLMLSDAQADTVSLAPIGEDAYSIEQVTVIPQREGRLFLNVTARAETDSGMMAKVTSIPIQVGILRPQPAINGELTTGEEGESLISMPAKEE